MKVFGYLLGNETDGVLFIRERHLLMPLNVNYKPVRLRKTMFRLLDYLLEKGHRGLVQDEVIMKAVWEVYGLKASGPRLWQVMNDLKKKLVTMGAAEDLVMRVEGKGYVVHPSCFEPLYVRATYDWFSQIMFEKTESSSEYYG